MEQSSYIYDLDDRPPLRFSLLYALQWAVIMFPVLIISAALPVKVLQLGPAEEVRFFQLTLLTSGFFTTVQCLWGHRYPVIDGPSTALLLTFLVLAPYGVPAIQGGAVLGGLLLIGTVLLIKPKRIIFYMTPNVVGTILMLIALTLLPYLSRLMTGTNPAAPGGSVLNFAMAIFLVLMMATMAHRFRGFLKTISLLVGMLIGTIIFYALELPSFKSLLDASWISIPSNVIPSQPVFALPVVIAFAVSYAAVVVNSIGSIQAIANVTSKDRLSKAVPRGLLMNGIGGVVCGFMGVIGMVSYSMSPGVVLSNRVASRFAVAFSGLVFMVAAFVPRLAALLALVPPPVVGAALCVAMGVQMGAALSIVTEGGMTQRDYYVVGLPVLLGSLLGFLPQSAIEAVPQLLRVLLGNGLIFGILLVLLLEHVLMRKERA